MWSERQLLMDARTRDCQRVTKANTKNTYAEGDVPKGCAGCALVSLLRCHGLKSWLVPSQVMSGDSLSLLSFPDANTVRSIAGMLPSEYADPSWPLLFLTTLFSPSYDISYHLDCSLSLRCSSPPNSLLSVCAPSPIQPFSLAPSRSLFLCRPHSSFVSLKPRQRK